MKIKSNGSITPNPFSIQQFNNNVDIKCFEIPRFYYGNTDSETDISELYDTNPVDLSKCSVVMRLSNPDDKILQSNILFLTTDKGENEFSDDDDIVVVNWIITDNVSQFDGKRTYQLEFYDGDVLAFRTQVMNFIVKKSLDTEENISQKELTILEQLEDELNEALDGIGGIEKNVASAKESADKAEECYVGSKALNDSMTLSKNELDERIANITDNASDMAEVIDARAGYTNLGIRLDKKPYYLDNVDSMKNGKLKNGDYVITSGYYSINDGGGSTYKIRTKKESDVIDNGSIIEINENLVAELIINECVNVKNFGAKGDGVNDDSVAIQKAINYCINNNNVLYIDNSTYLIETGLVVNGTIKMKIDGTLKINSNIDLLTFTCDNSIVTINNLLSSNNTGKAIVLTGKNYNNTFDINTIKSFEYGICYLGTSNGIQYTKTNFQLLFNKYNIYYNAKNSSWINQNEFFGGRCTGTYGVYLQEGENQQNRYDGNNFYNIGFEELYDAIILEKASLNSFHDFRMLENIENKCIITSSNCEINLFESIETSLALWDKIQDETNVYQRRNIYKMGIKTSDFKKGSEELTILNNLPFIRRMRFNTDTDGNRKYLASDSTFNTSSDPFNNIKLYTVSLSDAQTITINLDERYDYIEEDYNEFYIKIVDRNGDKNLIVKTNDNTEIFNLSTITGTIGDYSGIYKLKHITNIGSYKWVVEKIS